MLSQRVPQLIGVALRVESVLKSSLPLVGIAVHYALLNAQKH